LVRTRYALHMKRTHLEQLLQERDTIRPLVHIVERIKTPLHLLRIFFVFGVRGECLLGGSYTRECQKTVHRRFVLS
jgi:hypothetical protein